MGKRRLMKPDSGFAAVGILKALHKLREIDSAEGPFLGKGLPVGSVSLGSQSPSAPCEPSSLATARRWG